MFDAKRIAAFTLALGSGVLIGKGWDGAVPRADGPQVAVAADPIGPPTPPVVPVVQVAPTEVADLALSPAPVTPPRPSWTVRSEASAFDGFTDVYVGVASDAPLSCGPRRPATLMLRCLDDRTSAFIAHDCATPTLDGDGWDVSLRLDDAPVEGVRLVPDERGEALGHWTYRDAREFIHRLEGHETLHVRFTDLSGSRAEMSFQVAGLSDALPPLVEACGWSPTAPWRTEPRDIPVWAADEADIIGPPVAPPLSQSVTAVSDASAPTAESATGSGASDGPTRPLRGDASETGAGHKGMEGETLEGDGDDISAIPPQDANAASLNRAVAGNDADGSPAADPRTGPATIPAALRRSTLAAIRFVMSGGIPADAASAAPDPAPAQTTGDPA